MTAPDHQGGNITVKFGSVTRTVLLTGALTALISASALAYDVQGGTVKTSSSVNLRAEATTASASLGKLTDQPRNPYNEVDKVGFGPPRSMDSCAYSDQWIPAARITASPFPQP